MNNNNFTRSTAKSGLLLASRSLGAVLPPEANRILYAYQKVELAFHYSDTETDDGKYKAWRLSMEALHSLQQIENPELLPPQIRCAVRRSIDGLQEAVQPFDSVPQNVAI